MENFFQILNDPNLVYLLLVLGLIGILAEVFHPGAIVPGVAGTMALLLSFIGLGQLPFSWAGLALMGLAAVLVGIELSTSTSGILLVSAVVAFVTGSRLLYQDPEVAVTPWLIGFLAILILVFGLDLMWAVSRSRRVSITAGLENLLNQKAVVVTRLYPRGTVRLDGEVWTAEIETGTAPVEVGQAVQIIGLEGVVLKVQTLTPSQDAWKPTGWN